MVICALCLQVAFKGDAQEEDWSGGGGVSSYFHC